MLGEFLSAKKNFDEILNKSTRLYGLVFGYGKENAKNYERWEALDSYLKDQDNHGIFPNKKYKTTYLIGGCSHFFHTKSSLKREPSESFSSIEEERDYLYKDSKVTFREFRMGKVELPFFGFYSNKESKSSFWSIYCKGKRY